MDGLPQLTALQLPLCATRKQRDLSMVSAQQPRLFDVEPTEMEKAHWRAINQEALAVPRDLSGMQVPVGDVVCRILEDVVFEE